MHRGELFILSAPSGAGKTTLIQSVLDRGLADSGRMEFSVSHTTRKPRRGESDGRDYHFISEGRFREMIEEDGFLEWAKVHSSFYGTAKSEVFPRLERGIDVILDIDVQGAELVLNRVPEARGIFIMPPSYRDLELRLRGRGLDDDDEIALRLAGALGELGHIDSYHYAIVNDDAQRASESLASILLACRHRRERMQGAIDEVIADFRSEADGSAVPEAGEGSRSGTA